MDVEEFSFLSKETFNNIVKEYLQTKKSKPNDKQLITRSVYDDIKAVLLDSNSKLHDANFRYWCRKGFELLDFAGDYVVCKKHSKRTKEALINKGKSSDSLPVLILEDMYKVIGLEHKKNLHCGQKTLHKKLRSKWFGVKKKIVEEFVNHCEICIPRRTMSKSTLAAKPIVAKRFLSRLQVILIFNLL